MTQSKDKIKRDALKQSDPEQLKALELANTKRQALRQKDGFKKCGVCKILKEVTEFGVLHDGWQSRCKPCRAIKRKAWYEKHKESHKLAMKRVPKEKRIATQKRYKDSKALIDQLLMVEDGL